MNKRIPTLSSVKNAQNPQVKLLALTQMIAKKPTQKDQYKNIISIIRNELSQNNLSSHLKQKYESLSFLATYSQALSFKQSKLEQGTSSKVRFLLRRNQPLSNRGNFQLIQRQIKNSKKKIQQMQFKTQKKFYNNSFTRSENISIYSKSCSKFKQVSNFSTMKKNYNKKLAIFNGWISEMQQKQLEDKIKREIQKNCGNVYEDNIKNKLQNYIINHCILEKFLQILSRDPSKLQQIQSVREIYHQIKLEMAQSVIDEEVFNVKLEQLYRNDNKQNQTFDKKIKRTMKPLQKNGYFTFKSRQAQLANQIDKIFQKAKNVISLALTKYGKEECSNDLNQFFQNCAAKKKSQQKIL